MGRAGWHPTDSIRDVGYILSFGFSMWKLYDVEDVSEVSKKTNLHRIN